MSVVPGPPRRQEYTVCIDSRNRDVELYPEPNDFKLSVNFSRGLPVQRIYLGSFELPLPQYIIEKAWNRIYLSEGFALIVNNESELCLREFRVREFDNSNSSGHSVPPCSFDTMGSSSGDRVVTAVLPIWLNPIVGTSLTDSSTVQFTTLYDHALEIRGEWDWGQPIRIISTVMTDPSLVNLTADNPNFSITSPNTFEITNIPPPDVASLVPNQGGFVHAPAIANPEKLASMVTTSLNRASISQRYLVEYDVYRNQFCLKLATLSDAICPIVRYSDHNSSCCSDFNTRRSVNRTPSTVDGTITSVDVISAAIIASGSNCLSYVMGFGCTDLPLPPGQEAFTKGVCGQFCYQCLSYLELMPGNYNLETFPSQFSLQANRFYFEPTCMPPSVVVPPPMLVFSDECGMCHTAIIPFGKYSPESLAVAIQNAMNSFSPTNDYRVEYDQNKGKFVFHTVSGRLFGLEFEDPRDKGLTFIGGTVKEVRMSERLGFTPSCYRGQSMYMSNRPFHVPTKGCRCTSIPERLLSNIYIPLLSRSKKEFGINACGTRVAAGSLTDIGNGMVRVETSLSPPPAPPGLADYAHGFQPEDVVTVLVDPGLGTATSYELVVSEVPNATSFLAETSGLANSSVFSGAVNRPVCVSLFGPVILNLYFGTNCGESSNSNHNSSHSNSSGSSSGATPLSLTSSSSHHQRPGSAHHHYHSGGGGKGTGGGDGALFTTFPTSLIKSEITGFPPKAILWHGPTSLPFFAPNQFSLDPPDYLLVQLVEPNESKFIQHSYQSDTITSLFAKLVVYPPLRVERATPMETIFQGLKVVNQLHIRILTPDHRLYNFHGRNWSASLIFVVSAMSGSQLCY